MKNLIEQAKECQFGTPGEVIQPLNRQSVWLTPFFMNSTFGDLRELLDMAEILGIQDEEPLTEKVVQYICHEMDKITDAGEV